MCHTSISVKVPNEYSLKKLSFIQEDKNFKKVEVKRKENEIFISESFDPSFEKVFVIFKETTGYEVLRVITSEEHLFSTLFEEYVCRRTPRLFVVAKKNLAGRVSPISIDDLIEKEKLHQIAAINYEVTRSFCCVMAGAQ